MTRPRCSDSSKTAKSQGALSWCRDHRAPDLTVNLQTLATLAVLVFVICSMASVGLSLRMSEILAPLSNVRLVTVAFGVNFIVAPLIALGIAAVLPVNDAIRIGLVLLSTAAGAPFLPWLAQAAKSSTALAAGLLFKARYDPLAADLQPVFAQVANVGLILLIVLGIALNFDAMLDLVGSFGILAAILFVVILLAIGYCASGRDPANRSVAGLATAQCNISAARVVAGQNFDLDVVTYILVYSVIGLVILLPTAGEIGKRAGRLTSTTQ